MADVCLFISTYYTSILQVAFRHHDAMEPTVGYYYPELALSREGDMLSAGASHMLFYGVTTCR
jgi:hypothetical protein